MTDEPIELPAEGETGEQFATTREVAPRKSTMIEERESHWRPPPIALLEEQDFQRVVQLTKREVARMKTLRREVMEESVHYGTVPGTEKPSLWQPGAQLLNRIARYKPTYLRERIIEGDEPSPRLTYIVTCRLIDAQGEQVGEGLGAASSWEKKHRYRYAERTCPKCGQPAINRAGDDQKGRNGKKQLYYCWKRKGGCGANFHQGEPEVAEIEAQPLMQTNPDPHDLENTLLKMAAKRALVAATLLAHACSGEFSQDQDPDDPVVDPEEERAAATYKGPVKRQPANSSRVKEESFGALKQGQVSLARGKLQQRMKALGIEFDDGDLYDAEQRIAADYGVETFEAVPGTEMKSLLARVEVWQP